MFCNPVLDPVRQNDDTHFDSQDNVYIKLRFARLCSQLMRVGVRSLGMPERRLLDAAHIIGDTDEHLGQPLGTNGLPLLKLHHAAFNANLIGIILTTASTSAKRSLA